MIGTLCCAQTFTAAFMCLCVFGKQHAIRKLRRNIGRRMHAAPERIGWSENAAEGLFQIPSAAAMPASLRVQPLHLPAPFFPLL